MQKIYTIVYLLIGILFITTQLPAQTVVWSEDFDGNGGGGSNWGILNESIGAQGPAENLWYISDTENGNAVGLCGTGGGGDQSLHLGSSVAGDIGAAYEVGCSPGCLFCDLFAICINSTTDKRTQSQNINTVSQSNMTLTFNYIEGGDLTIDDCTIEFSINGGTTWSTLANPPKTDPGPCTPQGIWTAFSIALPASCENISNFRLAFRWINNADGNGVDPSFAVDDIQITTPAILPIQITSFIGKKQEQTNLLKWQTSSEINSSYFLLEKSQDGISFNSIAEITAKGNENLNVNYHFIDASPFYGGDYYRLKMVDLNGSYSYSEIIYIDFTATSEKGILVYPNPAQDKLNLNYNTDQNSMFMLEVIDVLGIVVEQKHLLAQEGKNQFVIDLEFYTTGAYLLRLENEKVIMSQLFVKQ